MERNIDHNGAVAVAWDRVARMESNCSSCSKVDVVKIHF